MNDDGELDESDLDCGHEDYTDAEMAAIHGTLHYREDDTGSVWGDLARDTR